MGCSNGDAMTTIREIIIDAVIASHELEKRIIEEDGVEDDYQVEAEEIIDKAEAAIKGRIAL